MAVGVEGLRRLNLPSAEEIAASPEAQSRADLLNRKIVILSRFACCPSR